MRRPTFLDLHKASRTLGQVGRIKCPNCQEVWKWDLDLRTQAEESSQEFLRDLQAGYMLRVLHEITEHFRKSHPEEES